MNLQSVKLYTAAAQYKVLQIGQFVRICGQTATTDDLFSEFVKANSKQGYMKSYFEEYPYLDVNSQKLHFEPI